MNKIFTLFLLFSFQIIFAQTTIRGKIIDNNTKETLIGANVIIKGTSIGTATNLDGFFKITTASGFPIVLTVSYLGYANKEVVVKGDKKDRIICANRSAAVSLWLKNKDGSINSASFK